MPGDGADDGSPPMCVDERGGSPLDVAGPRGTVVATVVAAHDDVTAALRLLRRAAEVDWVSDAASRYLSALEHAIGVVSAAQVRVARAEQAARVHAAALARSRAVPW